MKANRLAIENAVLKQAAPLNPIKTRQIVLALEDREYADLLEYNDREELNPASVNQALKRLAVAESNLFYTPEAAKDLDDRSFKGKAPEGSLPGKQFELTEEQQKVNEMLQQMGINKKNEAGGM